MGRVETKFKQTEVGLIPVDWEVKELKDIGDCVIGLTYSPSNVKSYGTLVLRSSNVQNGGFSFEDNVFVDMELPQRVIVKENDILICARNGSKHLIGKCALINKKISGSAFGAFMSVYRGKFPKLVFHQFRSDIIQKQIDETLGATINQITNKDLQSFKVVIPNNKTEQTAIVNALSDADGYIESLEKLIAKKQKIKQGAMQQLLKPKPHWEEMDLDSVGDLITGGTPPTQIQKYWNGLLPWVTPTDISIEKDIYDSERKISLEGLKTIRKLPANTLLVTCIASIGKNAILRNAGACNQQINAIIPNGKSDVDFLYYLIENNKNYLISKAGITATLMISKKDFGRIIFSFPKTKTEQEEIAKILSDMDSEITTLTKKLTKAKSIKQGMMQQLLTGKIRLV